MVFIFSRFADMPYYRRPYKRPRYGKKLKYSVQQKAYNIATTSASTTAKVEIVPPTDVEGMRKVKHLTVSLTTAGEDTSESTAFYWALVYVPQVLLQGSSTSHQQEHSQCMNLISLS